MSRMWGVLFAMLLLCDCARGVTGRLGRRSLGYIDDPSVTVEESVGQSIAARNRHYSNINWGRRLVPTGSKRYRVWNKVGIDLLAIRGGSSNADSTAVSEECSVFIQSTLGSNFLDKKKRLTMPTNSTILELKQQLAHKFPGSPPVALQRLFYGFKYLKDDDIVGNVSSTSPIPIMLDMISGTSVYNKSMSVSQMLEAYASLIVHQTYLHDKLKEQFVSRDAAVVDENMQTILYREMFDSINQTLYDVYHDDIVSALELEKDPEALSSDTVAWRSVSNQDRNPLTEALAKEFDLNFRGIKHYLYYSVLLVVFAFFGTNTSVSSKLLLCMVPFLWVSKVRQLRIAFKLVSYFLLPLMPSMGFIMPLLPAPLQVIAIELTKVVPSSGDNDDTANDDDDDGDVDEDEVTELTTDDNDYEDDEDMDEDMDEDNGRDEDTSGSDQEDDEDDK